jgi:hypothetical protein
MSLYLSYLEKLPDQIVRDDLTDYLKYRDYFNYNHIFYKIGEGNIFYPECFLYPNNEEINLYGGVDNGYHLRLKYNIEEKQYFFNRIDSCIFDREENDIIEVLFNTLSWNEMHEYIHNFFIFYVK